MIPVLINKSLYENILILWQKIFIETINLTTTDNRKYSSDFKAVNLCKKCVE